MSFRIIHHKGTKEALEGLLKTKPDQVKQSLRNVLDEDEYEDWSSSIDAVVAGNFSDELAPDILSIVINEHFKPVTDDWKLNAYDSLAHATTGKTQQLFLRFQNGRNFGDGSAGFGGEVTCGYLSPAEVQEAVVLLQDHMQEAHYSDDRWEKDFIQSLVAAFEQLASEATGDLFVMS